MVSSGVVGSGSGWKPALLVTVGKCDSICLRIKTMPLLLAGSQYQQVDALEKIPN